MTVTISRGFDDTERPQAAALFWQAFSAKLHKVMGPDEKGLAFFEQGLNPEFAFVARDPSGLMLGLAGFKTAEGAFSGGGLSNLMQVYGWFGAMWRALLLSVLERNLKPGVFQMDGIFVAVEARGKGVGTLLLTAVKDEARHLGMSEVQLDVIDTNTRARALYERQGFRAMGQEQTGPFRHIFGFGSATKMSWSVTPD